jgi:cytochrome P450
MKLPDGPRGASVLGSALPFMNRPLSFLSELASDYGDLAHFKLGPINAFLVVKPELIADVLVDRPDVFTKDRKTGEVARRFIGDAFGFQDGQAHRQQRRLVAPAFHHEHVAGYATVIAEHAQKLVDTWQDGGIRRVDADMTALALGIIAKTMFDVDAQAIAERVYAATQVVQQAIKRQRMALIAAPKWLPTPNRVRDEAAIKALDEVVYDLIRLRRKDGAEKGDLLSMLMLASDPETGVQFSDRQIRDEAVVTFIAGHETSAATFTWLWYLLGRHPQVAQKLRAELDTVLAGRTPTLQDLPRLVYTDMIVKEVLRLYPPGWLILREATESTTLVGYDVPKGSLVIVSPFVSHHTAEYFPEPDKFVPERFSDGLEKSLPRFVYFPFGGGPHVCIGQQFALLEARLVLATVAQRVCVELVDSQPVEPKALFSLVVGSPLSMRVTAREGIGKQNEVAGVYARV